MESDVDDDDKLLCKTVSEITHELLVYKFNSLGLDTYAD